MPPRANQSKTGKTNPPGKRGEEKRIIWKWRQLWPLKYSADVSGHYWRVAIDNLNGVDRIISTMSSWNAKLRWVVYSEDGGKTWQQLTKLNDNRSILGLETDPRDPKTVWFSTTTWNDSAEGAVYKIRDGGVTWQEITGNLPHVKPQILRFNPETQELWAGHVGLYKSKQ